MGKKPQARRPSSASASSVSMRLIVSVSIDVGASLIEKMRQVGRDCDHRLRAAPDPAQRLGDRVGIGVADQNGDDFERRRQHRLQHHQVHFERMLARERPRVDDNARHLSELGMSDRRDRHFAERRAPFRRRMNRNARKRDAMGGADDDDAARWFGATRPRAERRRGDRTRVDEAGMRRDDDLRRDAAIRASTFAHLRDQGVQRSWVRRVKHSRDLRGVDGLGRTRHEPTIAMKLSASAADRGCYSAITSPEPPNSLGKSLSFGSPSLIGRTDS